MAHQVGQWGEFRDAYGGVEVLRIVAIEDHYGHEVLTLCPRPKCHRGCRHVWVAPDTLKSGGSWRLLPLPRPLSAPDGPRGRLGTKPTAVTPTAAEMKEAT